MEEQKFKVIIVEDVKLELKGTEEIFRHEIPNAEVIGTAMTENEFWPLMEAQLPKERRKRIPAIKGECIKPPFTPRNIP